MIYETVHEIFSTLIIDYADIPEYFQALIILFELLAVFTAFKWVFYPLRIVMQFMRAMGQNIMPSNRQPRYRRNNDSEE